MNLADMLCYADIADLKKIADTYGCPSESHSKNELIQTILSTIQRRDVMESRVESMTNSELRFLNSLLFENRNAYSLEELKARALEPSPPGGQANSARKDLPVAPTPAAGAKAKPKSGKAKKPAPLPPSPEESARQSIVRFKNYGWLFNGFSQQTRALFQVPEDVKTGLCDALEHRYRHVLEAAEDPQAYRDERGLLADDAVYFLRFVRDYGPAITSEGVMYKRQLAQVLDLLSVGESLPAQAGWRFGYGRHFRDYPDRFSLLYDFVYYEGFVSESPDGYLAITPGGNEVAAGHAAPDPAKMYRFWLRLYKGAIPNLSSLAQWIARLSGEWITIDSLRPAMLPLIRQYYYDTPESIFEHRVLKMLMHLGILQWGTTADGRQVARATPQGKKLVAGHGLVFEDAIALESGPASGRQTGFRRI